MHPSCSRSVARYRESQWIPAQPGSKLYFFYCERNVPAYRSMMKLVLHSHKGYGLILHAEHSSCASIFYTENQNVCIRITNWVFKDDIKKVINSMWLFSSIWVFKLNEIQIKLMLLFFCVTRQSNPQTAGNLTCWQGLSAGKVTSFNV